MKIAYSARSLRQLEAIHRWIVRDNPTAASRVIADIEASISHLPNNPESGRPGRVVNTRELVVYKTPYIVVYRLHRTTIQIVAILHGARRWPPLFP